VNLEKRRLNAMFDAIAQNILDKDFELYSIDNNVLFEMRGPSGGIAFNFIYYIVTVQNGKNYRWGVKLNSKFECSYTKIADNLKNNHQKFIIALAENNAKQFDPDGGDLGTGDN